MSVDEVALLAKVNELISPYGCKVTELGPASVGVQGDARVYGPSVYVLFPINTSHEEISRISTEITNKVSGITRVLMEIPTSRSI